MGTCMNKNLLNHLDCIRPWLQRTSTCPECRFSITDESVGACRKSGELIADSKQVEPVALAHERLVAAGVEPQLADIACERFRWNARGDEERLFTLATEWCEAHKVRALRPQGGLRTRRRGARARPSCRPDDRCSFRQTRRSDRCSFR